MSDVTKIRQLSTIFTSRHFKALHEDSNITFLKRLHKKKCLDSECKTVLDSVQFSYDILLKKYRNEYVFKNTLFNKLLLGVHSLNTSTVINELRIGKSIADFVFINGEAHIYEIKTGLDNLDKLDKQIADYYKFSNKVSVVSESHEINKVLQKYQDSKTGVVELTKRNTLRVIKEADNDSTRLCYISLFKTLRKKEVEEVITDYFGFGIAVPNTQFFSTSYELLKRNISIREFQKVVVQKLKERKPRNQDLLQSSNVPNELNYLCYSHNLSSKSYDKLSKVLSCSVIT